MMPMGQRQRQPRHRSQPRCMGKCMHICLRLRPQRLNYYYRQRAMPLAQRTQK
jgi:hypothetical protein